MNRSQVSTKILLPICLLALLNSHPALFGQQAEGQITDSKNSGPSTNSNSLGRTLKTPAPSQLNPSVRFERVAGGKRIFITSEKPFATLAFVNDKGEIVSKPAIAHVKFVLFLPKNIRLIVGVGPGLAENPELLKAFPIEDIYGLDMSTDNFVATSPVENLLRIVVKFPNLKYLNLMGNPSNDSVLPLIEQFKKLESLTVSYTQITGDKLATLSSITRLRELNASRVQNIGKVLEKLKNSRTLRVLRVSSKRLSQQDFAAIATMKDLVRLDVSSSTIDQKNLNQICNLSMLDTLNMRYCKLNLSNFEPIVKLQKLAVFQVSYDMMRRYAILHSIRQRMPFCQWIVTN